MNVVEFTLMGQPFMAIGAGPLDDFNHSISFMIMCDTQAEIDKYWAALGEGGHRRAMRLAARPLRPVLADHRADPRGMMQDKDRAKAKRVTEAMLKMVKIDIAALKKAYDGG